MTTKNIPKLIRHFFVHDQRSGTKGRDPMVKKIIIWVQLTFRIFWPVFAIDKGCYHIHYVPRNHLITYSSPAPCSGIECVLSNNWFWNDTLGMVRINQTSTSLHQLSISCDKYHSKNGNIFDLQKTNLSFCHLQAFKNYILVKGNETCFTYDTFFGVVYTLPCNTPASAVCRIEDYSELSFFRPLDWK